MSEIILITGGCRSGKSAHAEARAGQAMFTRRTLGELQTGCAGLTTAASSVSGKMLYIATCPIIDDETAARVALHRERRASENWHTLEEQTELAAALASSAAYPVILVECLTLWVNNLIYHAQQRNELINENTVATLCAELIAACRALPDDSTVIFVTNETGLGLVPDNPAARLFRDLCGRCNQVIAAAFDEAVLLVSGLPLQLKKPLA